MYHPRPAFCDAERGQRDLRVIRLAFSLDGPYPARLRRPWFYAVDEESGDVESAPLRLLTESLWGFPISALRSTPPGGASDSMGKGPRGGMLNAWTARLGSLFPNADPNDLAAAGGLTGDRKLTGLFLDSRLRSSRLLPFFEAAAGLDSRSECVQWPWRVTLSDIPAGYEMNIVPAAGDPLRVSGYRNLAALWRDFRRGRLDALMLEGGDADGVKLSPRERQRWRWGRMAGTQQIILRFNPALAERLSADGRRSLSLAVGRGGPFGQRDLRGTLPALAYFHPVQPGRVPAGANTLLQDTRLARRLWLAQPNRPERLSILLLNMRGLTSLARQIGAQWQRTLNFNTAIEAVPPSEFGGMIREGKFDLWLDVIDLDNGSLQDLWDGALAGLGEITDGPWEAGVLKKWERHLQQRVPYIPILGNAHDVVTRGRAAESVMTHFCPACVPLLVP